jgi:hypothetical protein
MTSCSTPFPWRQWQYAARMHEEQEQVTFVTNRVSVVSSGSTKHSTDTDHVQTARHDIYAKFKGKRWSLCTHHDGAGRALLILNLWSKWSWGQLDDPAARTESSIPTEQEGCVFSFTCRDSSPGLSRPLPTDYTDTAHNSLHAAEAFLIS